MVACAMSMTADRDDVQATYAICTGHTLSLSAIMCLTGLTLLVWLTKQTEMSRGLVLAIFSFCG